MGKGEIALNEQFLLFPQCFSTGFENLMPFSSNLRYDGLNHSQNLGSSKPTEFADNNFRSDVNGKKYSKRIENNVGKMMKCLLRAIPPFPAVFSKYLYNRHAKTRDC